MMETYFRNSNSLGVFLEETLRGQKKNRVRHSGDGSESTPGGNRAMQCQSTEVTKAVGQWMTQREIFMVQHAAGERSSVTAYLSTPYLVLKRRKDVHV